MNIVKNLVLKNFIKIRCSIYFSSNIQFMQADGIFLDGTNMHNIHTYSIGLGLKYIYLGM